MGAISSQRNIVVRIDDLLIVVFALAWIARTALTKNLRFIKWTPINRVMLFYMISFSFPTLGAMITGHVQPLKGAFYIFKYTEYFLIFVLVTGVIKAKQQIVNYLKIFFIVFVIVNIYACTQIGQDRVSAPFEGKPGEPNTLGGYQVLMLAIILGLLTHIKSFKWKWPLIGISLFTLIPFTFTLSRASYAAIIPMYLTLIFFNRGRSRNSLIGFLIIIIISGTFFLPSVIKERIMYTFTPEIDESIAPVKIGDVTLDPSASARINDWIRLFDEWKQKPFMGYGVTGAGFVDSQYIQVLVETGLLGLAAFLTLLIGIFRKTLRIYRTTRDEFLKGLALGFLAGHVGMMIHALTANTFIVIRIMEPYWFLAAMVMMIPKIEKKTEPQPPTIVTGIKKGYLTNTLFFLKNGKHKIS